MKQIAEAIGKTPPSMFLASPNALPSATVKSVTLTAPLEKAPASTAGTPSGDNASGSGAVSTANPSTGTNRPVRRRQLQPNKGDLKGGNLFTPGTTATKGGRHRADTGSFAQGLRDAAEKTIKGLTGLGHEQASRKLRPLPRRAAKAVRAVQVPAAPARAAAAEASNHIPLSAQRSAPFPPGRGPISMRDLLRLLGPHAGVADDAHGHRTSQADVLHTRARRDDRRVLQDRQNRRHVPQPRLDGVDHLADVFGTPQRCIDLRLNAPVADAGEVGRRLDELIGLRRWASGGRRCRRCTAGRGRRIRRAGGRRWSLKAAAHRQWSSTPPWPPAPGSRTETTTPWRDRRRPDASRRSRQLGSGSMASPYSATGSSESTDASMPTLRNWSAAVLATATDVGSLSRHTDHQRQRFAVLRDPSAVVVGHRGARRRRRRRLDRHQLVSAASQQIEGSFLGQGRRRRRRVAGIGR